MKNVVPHIFICVTCCLESSFKLNYEFLFIHLNSFLVSCFLQLEVTQTECSIFAHSFYIWKFAFDQPFHVDFIQFFLNFGFDWVLQCIHYLIPQHIWNDVYREFDDIIKCSSSIASYLKKIKFSSVGFYPKKIKSYRSKIAELPEYCRFPVVCR